MPVRSAPLLLLLAAACADPAPDRPGPETGTEDPADTAEPSPPDPPDTTPEPVDADEDGSTADVDCDDDDPTVFPGAPDVCGDDRVTDCDRRSDTGLVTVDGAATFSDLQEALDAALPGSLVLVCPGDDRQTPGAWRGPFVAPVPVILVGHGGAEEVHLFGSPRGQGASGLSVPGGTTLRGLTLRNGFSELDGGGLAQTSTGTLVIEDCVIRDNEAGRHGAGIALAEGSTATLVRTTLRDNEAGDYPDGGGGGLYAPTGAHVDLVDSVVVDNSADFGGGLYLVDAQLSGGRVVGNRASGSYPSPRGAVRGGGLATEGDVTLVGTEISGNEDGGVSVADGTLTLVDVQVHDNRTDDSYVGSGAGLWAADAVVVLEGTSAVLGNVAEGRGGGVALVGSTLRGGRIASNTADHGGGAWLTAASRLEATVVEDNTADVGGGVDCADACTLEDVRIAGNLATVQGGGVVLGDGNGAPVGSRVLRRVEVVGNEAPEGGGVRLEDPTRIEDSLIADNRAEAGAGLWVGTRQGPSTLERTAVWRNSATLGCAAEIGLDGRLTATNTDWGVGADDNTPCDLRDEDGASFSGLGAGVSFQCVGTCGP